MERSPSVGVTWESLFIRMKNIAAGYSNQVDEPNGTTRKLDKEYDDAVEAANDLRLNEAAPVIVQSIHDSAEVVARGKKGTEDDYPTR